MLDTCLSLLNLCFRHEATVEDMHQELGLISSVSIEVHVFISKQLHSCLFWRCVVICTVANFYSGFYCDFLTLKEIEPKVEEAGEALLLKLKENDEAITELLANIEEDEVDIHFIYLGTIVRFLT